MEAKLELDLGDLSVEELDVLPTSPGAGLESINVGHAMVEIGASNCTSRGTPASCCSCCCC
ncbi:hypothetical protein J7W19_31810 [Streptomyces mobaraensis NBRC 13819 = DSM 40847]|uniref:GE37468 family thiazolyl peptide n=2 Tax=Streptomyces mobaraensis TaxID=35621 RepID=A0A5N5W4E1_STRMB|nr:MULTISPECIES: hypothetical protein [Streptomyces]EMF00380.1 hypothetical protein H340_11745 [Streptomyces mobaraensis NBRC 13819 = DSM 40847]KAB7839585.1 hypothetical protein FRZ00_21910 [Streptomyces mobaraensis]MBZ4323632.1 hypothetical protein [Streptomyces huiliensis]QTT77364.1 hypothetical protein J7W19_31810 [Streptomyces mobaraensis NBRC 13819 = DSM 40847]